jgi:hypothetical protein
VVCWGALSVVSLDLKTKKVMQEKRQNEQDVPHVCSTYFGGRFTIVYDIFEQSPAPFCNRDQAVMCS